MFNPRLFSSKYSKVDCFFRSLITTLFEFTVQNAWKPCLKYLYLNMGSVVYGLSYSYLIVWYENVIFSKTIKLLFYIIVCYRVYRFI